jgi:hypothetical protein
VFAREQHLAEELVLQRRFLNRAYVAFHGLTSLGILTMRRGKGLLSD